MNTGISMRMTQTAALLVILGGACALGLLLFSAQHTQHTPLVLTVIMAGWVLAPFVALAVANALSANWPSTTQRTLHRVMVVIALGSLAVYVDDAVTHRAAKPAFVYVVVPLASYLLAAIALTIAALSGKRRSTMRS